MSNLANSASLLLASTAKLSETLDQAYAHFSRGEWKEAFARLTRVAAQRPADAQLQAALGICSFKMENFSGATAAFSKAVQLDPSNAELLTQLAMAHIEQDQADQAEDALRRALTLRADEVPALRLLSGICAARGKSDEAANLSARANELEQKASSESGRGEAKNDRYSTWPKSVPTQEEIKLDAGLSLELGACSYIYGNHIQNPSGALTH